MPRLILSQPATALSPHCDHQLRHCPATRWPSIAMMRCAPARASALRRGALVVFCDCGPVEEGLPMSKSAEAFRTISEVAEDLDVPKHVLRFWEAKFPQIRPMKRGGGRRYYRPEDMELLRGIRRLLHSEGYTIKGVQKILREQGIDQVKAFADAPPTAEKAKGRGRGKVDGVTPPSGGAKPAEPGRKAGKAAEPKDLEALIRSAIGELEACRRLLTGERAAAEMTAAPRARASRG